MKKLFSMALTVVLVAGNMAYAGTMPTDLAQSHWAYSAVNRAAADDWLILSDGSKLNVDAAADRKTVARFIAAAWPVAVSQGRADRSLPAVPSGTPAFSDLGHLSAAERNALLQLTEAGVLAGYPGGKLKPDVPVTRLEMAVILSGLNSVRKGNALAFSDRASIPSWGLQALDKASASGLIAGYGDGTFRPSASVTRGEAVHMISRWVYADQSAMLTSRGTVPAPDRMVTDILAKINEQRKLRGLAPLRQNALLTDIALFKSSQMASENHFAHESLGGENAEQLFTRMGVSDWKGLGENLLRVKGTVTADKAVTVWMQSDHHREIILTPYTDTGIGIARAADGTIYITQAFAAF